MIFRYSEGTNPNSEALGALGALEALEAKQA